MGARRDPARFGDARPTGDDDLAGYFSLARGSADARPLEMTKWFDTNYHYLVPELRPGQAFELRAEHWLRSSPRPTRSGSHAPRSCSARELPAAVEGPRPPARRAGALGPVYEQLLRELHAAGAREVQLDEPCLVLDRTRRRAGRVRRRIGARSARPCRRWTVPRDVLRGARRQRPLARVAALPPAEVHLDLVRAPAQLDAALAALRERATRLSLGVVDGRNVWAADLDAALDRVDAAVARARRRARDDRAVVLAAARALRGRARAAARPRAAQLARVRRREARRAATLLQGARWRGPARRAAAGGARRDEQPPQPRRARTTPPCASAVGALRREDYARTRRVPERRTAQRERARAAGAADARRSARSRRPTRSARRAREHRDGALDDAGLRALPRRTRSRTSCACRRRSASTCSCTASPSATTWSSTSASSSTASRSRRNGWVQSYGSRCVKPPILFGDVARPGADDGALVALRAVADRAADEGDADRAGDDPAVVVRARRPAAQRDLRADRARDRRTRCADLEAAGASRSSGRRGGAARGPAAAARRAASLPALGGRLLPADDRAGARPETQIHTHMCYSEFNEIMEHIARLDADVLSIEASRSDMEVLDAFARRASTLPERDRARRLRHPLAARAVGRGGRAAARAGRGARRARAAVGQPRLRPQDAPLGGGAAGAAQPAGGGRAARAAAPAPPAAATA